MGKKSKRNNKKRASDQRKRGQNSVPSDEPFVSPDGRLSWVRDPSQLSQVPWMQNGVIDAEQLGIPSPSTTASASNNSNDGIAPTLTNIAKMSQLTADGQSLILPDGREIPKSHFDAAQQFVEKQDGGEKILKSLTALITWEDLDWTIRQFDEMIAVAPDDPSFEEKRQQWMEERQFLEKMKSKCDATGTFDPSSEEELFRVRKNLDMMKTSVDEESWTKMQEQQQQKQRLEVDLGKYSDGTSITMVDLDLTIDRYDKALDRYDQILSSSKNPGVYMFDKQLYYMEKRQFLDHMKEKCILGTFHQSSPEELSRFRKVVEFMEGDGEAFGWKTLRQDSRYRLLWPKVDTDQPPSECSTLVLLEYMEAKSIDLMKQFKHAQPEFFHRIVQNEVHPSQLPPIAVIAPLEWSCEEVYDNVRKLAVKVAVLDRLNATTDGQDNVASPSTAACTQETDQLGAEYNERHYRQEQGQAYYLGKRPDGSLITLSDVDRLKDDMINTLTQEAAKNPHSANYEKLIMEQRLTADDIKAKCLQQPPIPLTAHQISWLEDLIGATTELKRLDDTYGVERVEEAPMDSSKCHICSGSSNKMITLDCCSRSFCRKCIIRHGRKSGVCPGCQGILCRDICTWRETFEKDECFCCKANGEKGSMMICQGCKAEGLTTTYCSADCQKTAWKVHKWTCEAHRECLRDEEKYRPIWGVESLE